MLVIGHRGAPYEGLENSKDSFQKAIDAGADRIELDVRLTQDLVPVILHDKNLRKMASLPKKLKSIRYTELKKMKLNNQEDFLSLEEVLDMFLDRIEFNVELKPSVKEIVPKSLEVLNNYKNSAHKIIISSFESDYLKKIPDSWQRALLFTKTVKLLFSHELFVLKKIEKEMAATGCRVVHPVVPLVSPRMMELAFKNDWEVVPYFNIIGMEHPDPDPKWAYLKDLGCTGICTNYPRELRNWLKGIEELEQKNTRAKRAKASV